MHFGADLFDELRAAQHMRARFGDINGAIAVIENAIDRRFDPLRLDSSPNDSRSIMIAEKIAPSGQATSLPASDGAEP